METIRKNKENGLRSRKRGAGAVKTKMPLSVVKTGNIWRWGLGEFAGGLRKEKGEGLGFYFRIPRHKKGKRRDHSKGSGSDPA